MAREQEVDLVEVASGADPPVCRLLDYGKFKFIQAKKEKEARKAQKSTGLREVRFRPGISPHDLEAKSRSVQKLLATGAKVKVSVMFRGRSITHPELGVALLRKLAEGLQDVAKLERTPAMEGRMLSIILVPASQKDGKSKAPSTTNEDQKNKALVAQGSANAQAENT